VLSAGGAEAGDAFLRGGLIFHPRDLGLEGRWRANFGSDYAVNFTETIFVGFELQTSVFRQDTTGGGTATVVPANGFVNVKWKSPSLGLRPYGGGGLGLISDFVFFSGATDWESDFGFHLLGGVELGRLSLELQYQRGFESGSGSTWAGYAGFVF
jgi:hypothetical protein